MQIQKFFRIFMYLMSKVFWKLHRIGANLKNRRLVVVKFRRVPGSPSDLYIYSVDREPNEFLGLPAPPSKTSGGGVQRYSLASPPGMKSLETLDFSQMTEWSRCRDVTNQIKIKRFQVSFLVQSGFSLPVLSECLRNSFLQKNLLRCWWVWEKEKHDWRDRTCLQKALWFGYGKSLALS